MTGRQPGPEQPIFAGTSNTASPSAGNRVANGAPSPPAPSIAHSACGHRPANRRNSRHPTRSASTRIEVCSCNDPFTATAVHDRLCGSTAITTGPADASRRDTNLLNDNQHRFEETAHRLRAKQASLQPLTSTAMAGRRPKNSQPWTGDRCDPSDPATASDHGCRPDLLFALNKSV
jgi:hypothetical protein